MLWRAVIAYIICCFFSFFHAFAEFEDIKENIKIADLSDQSSFDSLWLHSNKGFSYVALNISVNKAGYAYDSKDKSGLSYFVASLLNHLWYIQRKNLVEHNITLNSFVTADYLVIALEAPVQYLNEALSILRESISYPMIDEDNIRIVEQILESKIFSSQNDTFEKVILSFNDVIFDKHPYSNSKYGDIETVANIDLDDVRNYISRVFALKNMQISVVGEVDEKSLLGYLDKHFLVDHNFPLDNDDPSIPLCEGICDQNFSRDFDRNSIDKSLKHNLIAFANQVLAHDHYAFQLLEYIIGGRGGLLYQDIRAKNGFTYNVFFSYVGNRYFNYDFGYIKSANADHATCVATIEHIFENMMKNGISIECLDQAKSSFIRGHILRYISNNKKMSSYMGQTQRRGEHVSYIDEFIDNINAVSLEDINELAKYAFDPRKMIFMQIQNSE